MWPRNATSHQKLLRGKGQILLELPEGVGPWQHLDFELLASRAVREYICFKPPSLQYFVTEATEK